MGTGWYRTTFKAPQGKHTTLVFDGAMSEARVYVNGKEVCFWPYGYNSFYCDVTDVVHADGKENMLAVRLENKPQSSRWYPGADCTGTCTCYLPKRYMCLSGVRRLRLPT